MHIPLIVLPVGIVGVPCHPSATLPLVVVCCPILICGPSALLLCRLKLSATTAVHNSALLSVNHSMFKSLGNAVDYESALRSLTNRWNREVHCSWPLLFLWLLFITVAKAIILRRHRRRCHPGSPWDQSWIICAVPPTTWVHWNSALLTK